LEKEDTECARERKARQKRGKKQEHSTQFYVELNSFFHELDAKRNEEGKKCAQGGCGHGGVKR